MSRVARCTGACRSTVIRIVVMMMGSMHIDWVLHRQIMNGLIMNIPSLYRLSLGRAVHQLGSATVEGQHEARRQQSARQEQRQEQQDHE